MTAILAARTGNVATMIAGSEWLNATQEAELLGCSVSRISRVRDSEPTHPANGEDAIPAGNRSMLAPKAAVVAWWKDWTPRTGGRRRVRAEHPEGLTAYQWRDLQVLAAGGAVTKRMRNILTELGLLDGDGQLTEKARALLAPPTPETT